jgi:hypothetical protein
MVVARRIEPMVGPLKHHVADTKFEGSGRLLVFAAIE